MTQSHEDWKAAEAPHLLIPEPEPLYLVCVCCGEAFASMKLAKDHGENSSACIDVDGAAFVVLPEDEAF